MSATQVRWLTNHFAQGKISREEFESLYSRIANSEQQSYAKNEHAQRKVLRLHPVTRRVLVQIRIFKNVAKLSKYAVMLAMISGVYIAFDYYKTNGTLSTFNVSAIESYFAQLTRNNLPTDKRHIYQFLQQWQNLDNSRKQEYQNQDWFRSFNLALSLQIADQRALIKQGDKMALQRKLLLVKLSENIDAKKA